MPKKKFSVAFKEPSDFSTLAICALRYCMGRQTYMPSLVRDIIRPFLQIIPSGSIDIMIKDCEFQKEYSMWGDPIIDKPGWQTWEQELRAEKNRREAEQ